MHWIALLAGFMIVLGFLRWVHHRRSSSNQELRHSAEMEARKYYAGRALVVATDVFLIFSEQLSIPPSRLSPDLDFYRDLEMHDLEDIEVILAIEEFYKCSVPDDLLTEGSPTIGSLIELLLNRSKFPETKTSR